VKRLVVLVAVLLLVGAPVALAASQEGAQETVQEAPPAQEGAATAPEEHAEEHGPQPINFFDLGNKKQPAYAYAIINFSVLMLLYYSMGKKPMAQALKDRRASVAKEIEDAQRMKREAEARAKQYQAKIAHLGDEVESAKRALHEAGVAERERIVQEAKEKAARMQKDAAFLLDQESKQTRLDLQRETVELAVAQAEELLKKTVTEQDQLRLAEDFLGTLETSSIAQAGPGSQGARS